MSFLFEFNCEIHHLPGPENVVADALIHPEPSNATTTTSSTLISALHPPFLPAVLGVSFSVMSLLQQSCSKVEFVHHSSALSVISVPSSLSYLLCDISTGILCPLVQENIRRTAVESTRNISHPVCFLKTNFKKFCLERSLQRCQFMDSVLSRMSMNEDSNPYQLTHPTNTCSWMEILTNSHRSGWYFFLNPMDILSCSPVLIEQVDGQKQFLFSLQQQKNVQRFYCGPVSQP